MRRRPLPRPVPIILLAQVTLRLAIICRVNRPPGLGTPVRSAPVSEITTKDEQLARVQLTRCPRRAGDPRRLDAIVAWVDGDVDPVAARDNFEAAVAHVGGIDGEEDGEVVDLLDVRVGGGVDVGREAAAAGELVVDLFFEEEHGFGGETVQDAEDARAS